MTPVILKTKNLKVKIYPKDHYPPHVHVIGPGAGAKFELENLTCISNYGFSEKDLSRIKKFLSEWQDYLMEAWHEYQD